MLDERDDDVGEVDVAQLELFAQDEREQEVERPFERVEVQLELAHGHRHAAQASGATGRGSSGSPSSARRARCGPGLAGAVVVTAPRTGA